MSTTEDAKHPRKARRITRACDYCHRRSIRCRASSEGDGSRCQNCVDFDQPCTYNRPAKRRGAKARWRSESVFTVNGSYHALCNPVSASVGSVSYSTRSSLTYPLERLTLDYESGTTSGQWRAPHVASQAVIMDLVEIYFEVISPM